MTITIQFALDNQITFQSGVPVFAVLIRGKDLITLLIKKKEKKGTNEDLYAILLLRFLFNHTERCALLFIVRPNVDISTEKYFSARRLREKIL